MKKILLFTCALCCTLFAKAQITQELRREIDMNDNGVDQVRVLGEKGLIVYGYVNERGAPDKLQINAYSTDFELIKTTETEYPLRSLYAGSIVSNDREHLYFFYMKKNMEFLVIDYNVSSQKMTEHTRQLGERFSPSGLRSMKDKLFVHGRKKGLPVLMVIDPTSGEFTFTDIPGDNKKRYVESMLEDTSNDKMAVFYRDGNSMKTSRFYVAFFDLEGDLLEEPLMIDRELEYSVIDGSITWLNPDEFIVSGTYGVKNNSLASGIYFSKFAGGKQDFITYHSFTDFDQFYSYLPQRQQNRLERKKNRKKNAGKEDFVKSLVEIHPIQVKKDHYLFVGEVYYPTYYTYTTYINGRPTTQQVFDGYQYSHAVVAGIDLEGNKLFDHCFSMFLSIKLKAAIVEGDDLTEREFGAIISETEGDRVKWTSFTRSEYWYDNYYIVYGSQKIKNRENDAVDRKRIVFFLSKIAFEM
jgi:hypothetical protein